MIEPYLNNYKYLVIIAQKNKNNIKTFYSINGFNNINDKSFYEYLVSILGEINNIKDLIPKKDFLNYYTLEINNYSVYIGQRKRINNICLCTNYQSSYQVLIKDTLPAIYCCSECLLDKLNIVFDK